MPHVQHAGANIYWEETGRGAPLLLIMGLGATLQWWNRLVPVVSPRFRTILFDNRGVGRSDVPEGPYSIPLMAADAAAVLDAAGEPSAHVCGLSMGGMIAQEFALQYPSRVRSLILGCTAPGGRDAVPAQRNVISALGARATMPREAAMRVIAPFIYDASTPSDAIEEDFAMRLKTNAPDAGYFAQLAAIRAWPGALSRLGGISAPTLVIHGETDELVPPENGRIVARAIPGARLVTVPHASHMFITDQFERSTAAILSFLEEQAGREVGT